MDMKQFESSAEDMASDATGAHGMEGSSADMRADAMAMGAHNKPVYIDDGNRADMARAVAMLNAAK